MLRNRYLSNRSLLSVFQRADLTSDKDLYLDNSSVEEASGVYPIDDDDYSSGSGSGETACHSLISQCVRSSTAICGKLCSFPLWARDDTFSDYDQRSIYRALSTPEAWVLNINLLLLLLSCIISLLPTRFYLLFALPPWLFFFMVCLFVWFFFWSDIGKSCNCYISFCVSATQLIIKFPVHIKNTVCYRNVLWLI